MKRIRSCFHPYFVSFGISLHDSLKMIKSTVLTEHTLNKEFDQTSTLAINTVVFALQYLMKVFFPHQAKLSVFSSFEASFWKQILCAALNTDDGYLLRPFICVINFIFSLHLLNFIMVNYKVTMYIIGDEDTFTLPLQSE